MLPTPIFPFAATNWLVPSVNPFAGKLSEPVMVSPALLTLVEASAVALTVTLPAPLVMLIPVPADNVASV